MDWRQSPKIVSRCLDMLNNKLIFFGSGILNIDCMMLIYRFSCILGDILWLI